MIPHNSSQSGSNASSSNSPTAELPSKPVLSDDEKEKHDIVFDLMQKRFDDEMQRIGNLDDKAGNLIGYTTIVTGLIVGLGTFDILEKLSKPEFYIPYFGGISSLLASIITALIAVRVSVWRNVPNPDSLTSALDSPNYYYIQLKRRVLFSMKDAVTINSKKNDIKASRVTLSWIFLIIGIFLIFSYLTIFLFTPN